MSRHFSQTADGRVEMENGLQPAPQPGLEQRAAIRRVVAQDTLDSIQSSAQLVGSAHPDGIILHDALMIEDLKPEWLREPVLRLVRAVGNLSGDPLDNKSVGGGKVRKKLDRVATRAAEVAEIYTFLAQFSSEILDETWLPVVGSAVEAAAHLQMTLTADTDEESNDARQRYEALRETFETELYALLGTIQFLTPEALDMTMPSHEEYYREVLGVNPKDLYDVTRAAGGWADRLRHAGTDPASLVSNRFAFLDSLDKLTDEEVLDCYVRMVFRLVDSRFPLLAHRSLKLTSQLLAAADETDSDEARELVWRFLSSESSWIVASAPPFDAAMTAYLVDDDLPAIVDALRTLSEGVLRPYGSLVCALAELVEDRSRAAPLTVVQTIGELEQRVRPQRSSIEALLSPLIRREWRNADAHERAVAGPAGDLILRLEDGSIEQVDANRVFGETAMLRSVLDGIDAAVNIFFATKELYERPLPDPLPQLSKEMILNLAREAVQRSIPGTVREVEVSAEALTITFVGKASRADLQSTLALIGRMTMGRHSELSAQNEKGKLIASVSRLTPGPGPPAQLVYSSGSAIFLPFERDS
jgi:hypothetical protein